MSDYRTGVYFSPSREAARDQAARAAVAERLRTARELEQARQTVRELAAAGRDLTETDLTRVKDAETVWVRLRNGAAS